ncbi:MAG: hypothetical protein KC442_24595 [Thermomicrobiales bacterium]|nr:hypothetical protein [Thermomicrobiales bacterium]
MGRAQADLMGLGGFVAGVDLRRQTQLDAGCRECAPRGSNGPPADAGFITWR